MSQSNNTISTQIAQPHGAGAPSVDGVLSFAWTDARGRDWSLSATPQQIELRNADESFSIPRERWGEDVSITPLADRYIARFSGPTQDVGFMVGAEALALAGHIGAKTAPMTTQSAAAPATQRAASTPARRVAFPKMNRWTILALGLAALAFIPWVGIGFAAAAVVVLVLSRRLIRPSADFGHVRTLRAVTWIWLGFNVAVWGVTTANAARASIAPDIVETARLRSSRAAPPLSRTAQIVLYIIVVVASLSVHECAHAITAWWNGDDHACSLGRVSLNPLRHVDPFGTVILPLMLAWAGLPVFGFARPVPVMPWRMMYHRMSDVYVSAAGPASNLLIACLCLALYAAIGAVLSLMGPQVELLGFRAMSASVTVTGVAGAEVLSALLKLLAASVTTNVLLATFNMLPVPPLDGSHVAGNLFPRTIGRAFDLMAPYSMIVFIVMLYSGAMGAMLAPTDMVTREALRWVVGAALGVA